MLIKGQFECVLCHHKTGKRNRMVKHIRKTHMNPQNDIICWRCKDKVEIQDIPKHLSSCERYNKFIETMVAFQCTLCAAENCEIRTFNTIEMFEHFTTEHTVFCQFLEKLSNTPSSPRSGEQSRVYKKQLEVP